MCFTFKKNNKQTKKPVNCFLQDDASAGIQSLQTSIEIKLCQNRWNGLSTPNLAPNFIAKFQLNVIVRQAPLNEIKGLWYYSVC